LTFNRFPSLTMTDTSSAATPSSDNANEVTINIKGPSELKLSITIALDKTVRDLKQAVAERSDVEADRQRLIYSGMYALIAYSRLVCFYSLSIDRLNMDAFNRPRTQG
jgi:hypothetical protein